MKLMHMTFHRCFDRLLGHEILMSFRIISKIGPVNWKKTRTTNETMHRRGVVENTKRNKPQNENKHYTLGQHESISTI